MTAASAQVISSNIRMHSLASPRRLRMAAPQVQLPEVDRISPACIRILGGNPGKFTLQGSNTYLLGTGPRRLLIDTGEGKPTWIACLKRVLADQNATVDKALITHWHRDHQGGVRDLLEYSPKTRIFKNQPTEGGLDITDGGKIDVLPIEDGQQFVVEGVSLTAVHTPGHTVDHMALVFAEEDALFTGDNVLGHGTAVFEDLGTYLDSLDKMQRLFSGRAYPGHGPVLEDGPAKISEYIRHRQQREEQVIQTLRAEARGGAYTVTELVKVIYTDVPQTLHVAAASGILQVLQKLKRQGRVSQHGEGWKLVEDRRPTL